MQSIRKLFLDYQAPTSPAPLSLEVTRAEGVFLYGPNGERYYDLISGVSVSALGHSHPKVVKAVTQQAEQFMHLMVYGEVIQQPQVALAKRLADLLPPTLSCTYFVNSGSEAVEGALKLAKRATHRHNIVAFRNAYHGSTHGALSVMGCEEPKQAFRPLVPGVSHIEFNNTDEFHSINTKTACVIVEPVQGEAGIIPPADGFLQALKQRCKEVGALLIFDEIQTGMGRTGQLFALQKYGVTPDILLLAKALGGGMPLGAFIASKELMAKLSYKPILGHITTFGGHPVSCAAGLAALNIIEEEKVYKDVEAKEALFRKYLGAHPAIRDVRSSGLLMAFDLGSFDRVQHCIQGCLKAGVMLDWFLFCNTAFRIAPPLNITNEEIEGSCSIITSVLDNC